MKLIHALLIAICLLSAPARADTCAAYPYDSDPRIASLVAPLRPLLAEFPSIEAALSARRPAICLHAHLHDAHGYLDAQGTRIVIAADIDPALQGLILLHELRHLDQLVHGSCPSPDLSMQSAARAVMAMEADASAISLLAAWRLRDLGTRSVWDAATRWPSQADIARAFARRMTDTDDPAGATAAAFAQWFASDARRNRYYLAACDDYLATQDRTKRLPQYRALPQGYLDGLCRMPGGRVYPCAVPEKLR